LVQDQGETELKAAGILGCAEELKRGLNAELGPKDFFEIAYRSGFKISDQVREQGAGRCKSGAYSIICEHFAEACNTAIGPQMGF
jgi:hypothetical protein